MMLPGLLAIVFPVIIGFAAGRGRLGRHARRRHRHGVMLGIQTANSGGAMDNAKKYIEEGHFGGKNSEAHKAAVVGDTVGDPLKDTVGTVDQHPHQADVRDLAGARAVVRGTDLVRSSPAFPKERPALALTAALSASRIVIASRFDWDWAMPPSPVEAREALDGKARVARNIQAIVELKESLSSGQRLLVVVSPFRDLPENPPLPDDVAIVLERESIELVQLDSPELLAEENFVDHIHLSETGHARVAEKLVEALKPLLKQP
jgi:hypothetical protein